MKLASLAKILLRVVLDDARSHTSPSISDG
jgi:hypothetical protein